MPLRSFLSKEPIGGVDSDISEAEKGYSELPRYDPVKYNTALYFTPEARMIRIRYV